jgi:hypothetical protein
MIHRGRRLYSRAIVSVFPWLARTLRASDRGLDTAAAYRRLQRDDVIASSNKVGVPHTRLSCDRLHLARV